MNLTAERIALLAERLLSCAGEAADRGAEATLIRLAGLPFRKSLAEFELAFQPSVSEKQLRELLSERICEHAERLRLYPPGRERRAADRPRRGGADGLP